MRAALSVVIPTLNAGANLGGCLGALMEGVEAGVIRELVVTDGGSDDATLEIADAAGAVIVQSGASRGGQLRRGAQAAGGEWLLFLHSDTVLPVGWPGVVSAQMARGGAGAFRLSFDAAGMMPRLVAGWANLRTRMLGLPYGDQALLISRVTYEAVGGFADIPLMEDVAMARALKGRIALLPLAVTTSAARYQRAGWVRRGGRNLGLVIRYLCGADPVRLAETYRRKS
ncbi:TIGR04283 family arsenosugar biosynthesis glycosyltransferase [Roseovarius sp.]|uniref:TIGR04283 family arsenosugar biosynthesis glycosyltransferase n=1 Tax=Roseovarius sp. TaxID=1486281 RepID=UPI003A9762A3